MSTQNLNLMSSAEDWAKAYPQYAGLLAPFMNNGMGQSAYPNAQAQNAIQDQNRGGYGGGGSSPQGFHFGGGNMDNASGVSGSFAPQNKLQALMQQNNNNGQGTQLNPSPQQNTTQPQQVQQTPQVTPQDTQSSYQVNPQQQQHEQTVVNAIKNGTYGQLQQQMGQQQQQPQSRQPQLPMQTNPYLQEQNEMLAELKTKMDDVPLMSFGEDPNAYAQRVQQSKDAYIKNVTPYMNLLDKMAGTYNDQQGIAQAGAGKSASELQLQQLKNQGELNVAKTQFGQSDLEDIGGGLKLAPNGSVYDADGKQVQLPDVVEAALAKTGGKQTVISDNLIKDISASNTAIQKVSDFKKYLTDNSLVNPNDASSLAQNVGAGLNPLDSRMQQAKRMAGDILLANRRGAIGGRLTQQEIGFLSQIYGDPTKTTGAQMMDALNGMIKSNAVTASTNYSTFGNKYDLSNYKNQTLDLLKKNGYDENGDPISTNTQTGMIQMKAPDGKTYPVHPSQVQAATAAGMVQT